VRIALAGLVALMALCMSMPSKSEDRTIWVFGDSLSGVPGSWANLLHEQGYATVRNLAIPGMRGDQLSIPDYLSCGSNETLGRYDEVIIWIGANDAFRTVNGGNTLAYERKLVDALQYLQGRKCTVYLLHIPTYAHDPVLAPLMQPFRTVQRKLAQRYSNVTLMPMLWDKDLQIDRIHQDPLLHQMQMEDIVNKLGMY
jgi:hypothetical protein